MSCVKIHPGHTDIKKILSSLLCIILVLFFAAGSVSAASEDSSDGDKEKGSTAENTDALVIDPLKDPDGYTAVLYDNMNGLPTSEANDIVQTSDGCIWIGSYSGLIRYDGSTFERIDPSTGITSVKCLYVDSQERLWIGTNDNGIALMENGGFRIFGVKEGLKSSSVQGIVEDDRGMIYITTTRGIAFIDPPMHVHGISDSRIGDSYLHELVRGTDGSVYGLTNYGDVFVIKSCMVTKFLSHEDTGIEGVSCIFPDPLDPGFVYVEAGNSKVYHGSLETALNDAEVIDIDPLSQVQSFEYIDERIWICAGNGIGYLAEDGFHMLENTPLINSIGHIRKDYEGNLWFTSTRQGVMKVVPNRFVDLNNKYGLPNTTVNTTCLYNGLLFIGTDTGLRVLDENGLVDTIPVKKAATASGREIEAEDLYKYIGDCRIRSIIRDSKNRLWIATWRKNGLVCYDNGNITEYNVEDGLFSDHVRTVCETKDGRILVANTGGLTVIEDGKVTGGYDEKDDIINTEILTVCEGPDGDILLGSDGGGIYVIGKYGVKNIGAKEGLTSEAVMRIKHDEKRDVYWIVTGNCLAYLTPEYKLHVIKNFPYSNNFDLYENSMGEMWILSSNGIYIIPTDILMTDTPDMEPVYYSMHNGLPCIATANSYSELTDDGDLYIAGSTGVAKVNVNEPYESIEDIKSDVPFINTDGVMVFPDEEGNFTIPSNVKKLTIYSYVYNYSLIDPQVSYRLEGFDEESVTVSKSDLLPLDYTNLPGGTYNFVLEVRDPSGNENKSLSVQIIKEKAFYEHPTFYILAGLALALLLLVITRAYIRKRIRNLEKKHKEEAEKERINGELKMASGIQASMLPHDFPPFPDRSEFDLYASMDPAREVGGDFYDFYMIDDDHLGLTIADVSGKGIPASLFMMVSKALLKNTAMMGLNPDRLLTKINETICSNNTMEMFVTVWLGILEISTGKLTAANAGHEYPAVAAPDGRFKLLKDKHGLVIGGMDCAVYKEYEIQLDPGSKVFVYTDGVPEATNSSNELFGTDRMLDALNSDTGASPEQILANVQKAVDDFVKEAEQFDDLTMLCLEYNG